jgi:hypothetical protein
MGAPEQGDGEVILKLLFDQKIGRLLQAIAGVVATVFVAFHLVPLAFLKPDPMQKALAPTWVTYWPMVLGLAGLLLVALAVVALRKAYREVRNDMGGGGPGTPPEAAGDETAAAARVTPKLAADARQASRNPASNGFGKRG